MISVITCCRTPALPTEMQKNIASTVGVDYELITIDNSQNKYSIFQAYNRGIELAKGDIYCFVHDDVLFRTEGWGYIIEEIFKDKTIGQVGVAGGHYLPKVPAYWSEYPYISIHVLENICGKIKKLFAYNYFQNDIAEVVAIDGICMFFPSWVFKKIKFDELTFTGFHFYDMDISMQIQQLNLKVVVTKKILVEHARSGKQWSDLHYMSQFQKNKKIFFTKWSNSFPINKGIELTELEKGVLHDIYSYGMIYNSLAYILGKFILHPNIYNIKRLFYKVKNMLK